MFSTAFMQSQQGSVPAVSSITKTFGALKEHLTAAMSASVILSNTSACCVASCVVKGREAKVHHAQAAHVLLIQGASHSSCDCLEQLPNAPACSQRGVLLQDRAGVIRMGRSGARPWCLPECGEGSCYNNAVSACILHWQWQDWAHMYAAQLLLLL